MTDLYLSWRSLDRNLHGAAYIHPFCARQCHLGMAEQLCSAVHVWTGRPGAEALPVLMLKSNTSPTWDMMQWVGRIIHLLMWNVENYYELQWITWNFTSQVMIRWWFSQQHPQVAWCSNTAEVADPSGEFREAATGQLWQLCHESCDHFAKAMPQGSTRIHKKVPGWFWMVPRSSGLQVFPFLVFSCILSEFWGHGIGRHKLQWIQCLPSWACARGQRYGGGDGLSWPGQSRNSTLRMTMYGHSEYNATCECVYAIYGIK